VDIHWFREGRGRQSADHIETLMRIWSMVEDGLYWRSADVKVYPQEATRSGSYLGPGQQSKARDWVCRSIHKTEANDLQI